MSRRTSIFDFSRSAAAAAAATTLAVAAAGCLPADEPLDAGEVQQAHITWNGLTFELQGGEYYVQHAPWAPWIKTAYAPLAQLYNDPLVCQSPGTYVFGYIARCALADGDTLDLGCHKFAGALGQAPQWGKQALTLQEQLGMTACLAAHYNEVTVDISIRDRAVSTPDEELARYAIREGAFWGNLFALPSAADDAPPGDASATPGQGSGGAFSQPEIHTCRDAHYDQILHQRDCTVGKSQADNPCGFIPHLPDCQTVCKPPIDNQAFPICDDAPAFTTFLTP